MQLRKIWDGGVRLFHWSQLLLIIGLWWTAEQELFGFHMLQAYVLASLVGARIIWGFIGSETARFRHFVPTLNRLLEYRRNPQPVAGHNPLSALMIIALIVAVVLQWGSGLMASDDLSAEGPLYSLVSSDFADFADGFHHWWFNTIIALAGIHALAAIWHQRQGDKVITAMFSGKKAINVETELNLKPGMYVLFLTAVLLFCCYLWQGENVMMMVKADAVTVGWMTIPQ